MSDRVEPATPSQRVLMTALLVLPATLLVMGFFADSPREIVAGIGRIVVAPSVLLTDYLAVGGLGATLVNAGLCGLISCLLMIFLKIEVNGPFIAAVYTVIGFAFFGKNIFNIWPIFVGVAIYARTQQTPLKNYALVALFGTTLAPLVSFISFGSWVEGIPSVPLGLTFGVAVGCILPPLASHMLRFHDGFNIYNIGFTGGIIGSFVTALLRSFHFEVETIRILEDGFSPFLNGFFTIFFVALILWGLWYNRGETKPLREALVSIHRSSGRLVSDFTIIGNHGATFLNMGIMGLISLTFVALLSGSLNGPVVGGVLTVVGFAAFGKHTRNCVPILLGVYLGSLLKVWESTTTEVIITGLFGTTLAPITGQYGFFAGITAGFCHLSIVMNVGMLHGGVNLYNNGFAGGFVASFLAPIIDAFKQDRPESTD